ncbi:MAG: hypothetical protein ACXW0F_05355 [Gaiellaceae bacterium]
MTTYAVKWREPDGQTFIGRLALGPRTLRLVGRTPGAEGPTIDRQIGYAELQGLRVGTHAAERLDGRPALVVDRADGSYVVADAGMGASIVQELVDRLAHLRRAASRKATVVVSLKEGAIDRVRGLVAQGPPFDPVETALTRHELFLTPREAIFVFEAETEDELRALLGQLDIWAAAAAWGELVEGVPRLADVAYSWERPEAARELRQTRSRSVLRPG